MLPVIKTLSCLIAGLFRPGITPIKTSPDNLANIEQDGALIPNAPLVQAIQSLASRGAPAFGNFSQTVIPASLAATTYNANSMVGTIIRRFGFAAASTTDSTDTGTNIVNAIPGAVLNQTWLTAVANMGSNSLVMAAGSGVSMTGTNVIAGFSMRLFLGQVLASNSVGFTGLFSMPLSSSL